MKLMTQELQKRFEEVGSQEENKNPTVIAHFFHPLSNSDWYATEYDPENKIFFGYASLTKEPGFDEFGYFSKEELESVKIMGLGIERDLYWQEKPMREIMVELYHQGDQERKDSQFRELDSLRSKNDHSPSHER